MELCRILGRPVVDSGGRRLGTVADLSVRLDSPHPAVTTVAVADGRRARWDVPWSQVLDLDEDQVVIAVDAPAAPAPADALLLRRDVLDAQVFDVVGKRVARIADVRLARRGDELRVVGVEVGAGAVLRRLGLARLARRRREDPIDWAAVHLVSGRGHSLQLDADPHARRLSPSDMAEVLARLPTERGATLLERLPPRAAADALSHSRPRVSGRLVRAVASERAATIVTAMPGDDATAALRHVPPDELDDLLSRLDSERAAELRRLLQHPARTAGGLMNPDITTARPGESAAAVRDRLASRRPRLDAMLTVFVVDDERFVGAITPGALIAGDVTPVRTPTVRPDAPVEDVVDVFAVHDLLALPVVDGDGRLLGAIAVDDILEELLAERLPGRRRFWPVRGRRV